MAGNPSEAGFPIDIVHKDIDACLLCASSVQGFLKPSTMNRGDAGKIMIVGKGPGKTEIEKGKAFSGPAGKRLEQWLRHCVPDPENARSGIYFTSVTKCLSQNSSFPILVRNCAHFLDRQFDAIRPALVVTLGQEAYESMRVTDDEYSRALCQLYDSSRSLLFTRFGWHYELMVWPHPSGLNRWLNEPDNILKLGRSFETLRPIFTDLLVSELGSPR